MKKIVGPVSKNTAKHRRYIEKLRTLGKDHPAAKNMRLRGTQSMKAWNARWRKAAIEALGGKCIRCGFHDPRALQIDHVHGDGWKQKVKGSLKQGRYYRAVIENISSGQHQLLCANCNWIKRVDNKEHS